MDYAILLATMTATEFKAFRKAFLVLLRAGMNHHDAISVLCERSRERIRSIA